MNTQKLNDLPPADRKLLQTAVERLPRSLNKVSNPRVSAVVLGARGHYFGVNNLIAITRSQHRVRYARAALRRSGCTTLDPQCCERVIAFLSNCTLSCAEANALGAAAATGDWKISKLYLAIGRADTNTAAIALPCGTCRQILHDFARLNGKTIDVYATNNAMTDTIVTNAAELLPEAFTSVSLGKMA